MPGSCEPNPLYDPLHAILRQELFGSWSGVIFRSVSPRYARAADIVSGYGSYCAGGRWNAPGIYAIYGSIEPGLAADESFKFLLQHFGWQDRDIPPRMVVGIRVSLPAVLDLTNPANVPDQLNLEELLSEDWRKMNGEQKGKPFSSLRASRGRFRGGDSNAISYSDGEKLGDLSAQPKAWKPDRGFR
jgi:RES domain-containing protein